MDDALSKSVINSVVELEIESQICRYDFNRIAAYTYVTLTQRSVSVFTGFMRMYSAYDSLAGGSLGAFSQHLSAFRNKG